MTAVRIVRLEAQNIKRLRAIGIDLDPGVNIISGNNGQGKSSVLDCIQYALGGKREQPESPVRKGATKAQIVVKTGDFTVTRRWTKAGNQQLDVAQNGERVASPQVFLDKIVGSLSFDPLRFLAGDAKKQAETLRAMAGLDFSGLASERAGVYDLRRDANANVRSLAAQIEGRPAMVEGNVKSRGEVQGRIESTERANREAGELKGTRDNLILERQKIHGRLEEIAAQLPDVIEKMEAAEALTGDARPLYEEMDTIDEHNRAVADTKETVLLKRRLTEAQGVAAGLDQKIEDIDESRRNMIESAKYPVEGLKVDAETVTFNDIPLDQCSQAEKIRVSAAIGMETSGDVRVMLIRDGSLLDDESMKLLAGIAAENEYQMLIERVVDDSPARIVIEDGGVVGEVAESEVVAEGGST